MYRWTSLLFITATVLLGQTNAWGQLKVEFPADSPVSAVGVDQGASGSMMRGSAVSLDIHASLSLRNNSTERIRAITLLVTAAELTAGGKASVTIPSLDVRPGETFPVRVDLRLLRPASGTRTPVLVTIDGILFDTLNFYGPNKLNSRRSMLAWELEARRDRKHFIEALSRSGQDGLRREMIASLNRQSELPRMNVQVVRGRVSSVKDVESIQFAALDFPEAPIEILNGSADRADQKNVLSPRFELRNRSRQDIRFVELGWNALGGFSGSLPAPVMLAPGKVQKVDQAVTLRFPTPASSLSAYIASVEYGDGSVWIPSRHKVIQVSPEEQRLSEIYRRKGLDALVQELRKFE